jgi:hypothetical protein
MRPLIRRPRNPGFRDLHRTYPQIVIQGMIHLCYFLPLLNASWRATIAICTPEHHYHPAKLMLTSCENRKSINNLGRSLQMIVGRLSAGSSWRKFVCRTFIPLVSIMKSYGLVLQIFNMVFMAVTAIPVENGNSASTLYTTVVYSMSGSLSWRGFISRP